MDHQVKPSTSVGGFAFSSFVWEGLADMEIRRAEFKDIKGIMSLLYQVAEVHHKGRPDIFMGGASKYSESELADIIADNSTPIFVAESDGDILGHAFCVLKETGENGVLVNHKSLYIDDICVDENARGRHVGTALCKHVLAFAKEQSCYNVTLNVWTLNDGAMAFYRAMGFKEQKITMETIIDGK